MSSLYRYVGPADLLSTDRPGTAVRSPADLAGWLAGRDPDELTEPFTYVVDLDGVLRLAPRRSEHVGCAAGGPVRAAGEITFVRERDGWAAGAVTNQSTGYCPRPSCWPEVAAALDRAAVPHGDDLEHAFEFRRCPGCGQVNVVREEEFDCAVCGHPLPRDWNVDRPDPAELVGRRITGVTGAWFRWDGTAPQGPLHLWLGFEDGLPVRLTTAGGLLEVARDQPFEAFRVPEEGWAWEVRPWPAAGPLLGAYVTAAREELDEEGRRTRPVVECGGARLDVLGRGGDLVAEVSPG
ncbi:hypothetical protein [Kitasatospora sp. MBT63]|uniref:hypothetical protein n=1 Tax=Kitasatospora sp. MBT63 TaxID=1444768 RepID=UPI0007C6D23E